MIGTESARKQSHKTPTRTLKRWCLARLISRGRCRATSPIQDHGCAVFWRIWVCHNDDARCCNVRSLESDVVSLFTQVRSCGKQELMDPESRPTDEIDLEDHPSGPGFSWTGLAGPAALGRSVLLAPGVDPPTPWANCERISLNDVSIVSPTTLRVVRRTFLTRSPFVYEIDPAMREPSGGTDQRDVWGVEPNTDLVAEATWRLACTNAVDGRDVSHPTWPLAAMAMKAGASPVSGRDADVVLPD